MTDARRRQRFDTLIAEMRSRRGDRSLGEAMCKAAADHYEQHHWGRTLAEVRQLDPEAHALYATALGQAPRRRTR